jgi:hypothetical protein
MCFFLAAPSFDVGSETDRESLSKANPSSAKSVANRLQIVLIKGFSRLKIEEYRRLGVAERGDSKNLDKGDSGKKE